MFITKYISRWYNQSRSWHIFKFEPSLKLLKILISVFIIIINQSSSAGISSLISLLQSIAHRFQLTGSNITGVFDMNMFSPLTVSVLIMDSDKFQSVDNHAFTSSAGTLTAISLGMFNIFYLFLSCHSNKTYTIPYI